MNNDLDGFSIVVDESGKIIGYQTAGGADTVFPFSNEEGSKDKLVAALQYSGIGITSSMTYDQICNRLLQYFPASGSYKFLSSSYISQWIWPGSLPSSIAANNLYLHSGQGSTAYARLDFNKPITIPSSNNVYLKANGTHYAYNSGSCLIQAIISGTTITLYNNSFSGWGATDPVNANININGYKGKSLSRLYVQVTGTSPNKDTSHCVQLSNFSLEWA